MSCSQVWSGNVHPRILQLWIAVVGRAIEPDIGRGGKVECGFDIPSRSCWIFCAWVVSALEKTIGEASGNRFRMSTLLLAGVDGETLRA
ncbi:uncharacterized protein ColSpa_03685 [Colletotrichum spaethianum]|uniref:Uncharacterized protein n=1 Tax=Colletotrichum spaethianum TaxID=700344 RepID=A0AA37P7E6_9PEZI|nr:uncharacterized protein ColSpa_03685 [Colletotrichum spaethianum]GKT43504.1 hypothetical protein ColSpa_03685 [Colletotrichum spaethianum]